MIGMDYRVYIFEGLVVVYETVKRRRSKNLRTSYTEQWFYKSVLRITRDPRPIPRGPVDI